MINILIVGLMDVKGGIEQLVYQICTRMDQNIFHCDFLAYCPKCAYEDELKAMGGHVYHITRRGVNPLKCRNELKVFFKSHQDLYDYIWFHGSSASNKTGHIFARKYTNAQIISHSHGTFFDSKGRIRKILHTFLHHMHQRKYMACTDYCFACSRAAGQWLFGKTDKEVYIIKNGIEIQNYQFNQSIRDEYRKKFAIENNTVIGHAGRFCTAKNQDFILDIFNEVLKEDQNYMLLLAGEGELLEKIKQKADILGITGHVIFAGYRDDWNNMLQAIDLLLLPSLYEGLPIVAIEAQANGLPCLLSDTITDEVGITDLVEYMSLNCSEREWASKIINLIKKNAKNDRNRYREKILENGYDIHKTINSLEKFFMEHDRKPNGGKQ